MLPPGPVLAIFAHTDDEVLGCGATLWSLRQAGIPVIVNWLCYGIPPREPEHETHAQSLVKAGHIREAAMPRAMKRLGITQYTRLGQHEPAKLDQVALLTLARAIETSIDVVKPITVITHNPYDVNQDHRRVYEAVQIAVRQQPPRADWNQSVKHIWCVEIGSCTDYILLDGFHPTVFVDVPKQAVQAKQRALAAYTTEVRPAPHPRSTRGVEVLAARRGQQIGTAYAEAFIGARSVYHG